MNFKTQLNYQQHHGISTALFLENIFHETSLVEIMDHGRECPLPALDCLHPNRCYFYMDWNSKYFFAIQDSIFKLNCDFQPPPHTIVKRRFMCVDTFQVLPPINTTKNFHGCKHCTLKSLSGKKCGVQRFTSCFENIFLLFASVFNVSKTFSMFFFIINPPPPYPWIQRLCMQLKTSLIRYSCCNLSLYVLFKNSCYS